MRASVAAVAAAVVVLALPAAAAAHANLVSTSPPAGAVLAHGPAAVRVVFDDVVSVGPGNRVVRNGGGAAAAGAPRVAGGKTLVLPLRPRLADGDYSVRWSIVSDDGHLESGVFAFAVGAGRAPPSPELKPEASGPQPPDVTARWLFLGGLLVAVGVALLALLARVRDDERVALVVATAAVVSALGAADGVHRVGLGTRAGSALLAGALTAVVVATLAAAATLERRALRPALVLALCLAVVPATVGHALDRGLNRVNVVADVLHVAGAAVWVGALVALLALPAIPRRTAVRAAAASVGVIAITGVVRASFELVRLRQLWDVSYGRTILVKTAIFLGALAVGLALRVRIRPRAGVELLLAAGVVVAVSVLVLQRPGRSTAPASAAAPAPSQAGGPFPAPPSPPAAAVVLARELGYYGVAVAAEPQRLTALVLSNEGGGASGLDVELDGRAASPCGSGCYRVTGPHGDAVRVGLAGREIVFAFPRQAPPARALLRRAHDRFAALSTVDYDERIASSPTLRLRSRWRLEAPNRLSYRVSSGAAGIIIGSRRWDRATAQGKWVESPQTPLEQPTAEFLTGTNARRIAQTAHTVTLSYVDPQTPAYFTVVLDRGTLLPRFVHMTAAAHFMVDRYLSFDSPPAIRPPR